MSWGMLAIWTGFALAWWIISLLLVAARPRRRRGQPDLRRITVFKAVPCPLSDEELVRLAGCIESFVADLDDRSELLIGVAEQDRKRVSAVVAEMRGRYPQAELRLVTHVGPDQYANPKVSTMKSLARHATGDLWFWSDADMQAPPGTLDSLRQDLAASGAGFVTSPYLIRATGVAAELLDKLFVNLEFYPGVVLLGGLNRIRFALGSGILFEAEHFRRRVDWDLLGSCLADDFHLGRLLGPGRLGATRLITVAGARDWWGALLHYMRWHKTIRWCRPGSYALQLLVLPVVGWLLAVVRDPTEPLALLGLVGVITLDTATAYSICRVLKCRLPWQCLPVVASWSLLRGITWVACWFPWPIVWRGRKWWSARQQVVPRAQAVADIQAEVE